MAGRATVIVVFTEFEAIPQGNTIPSFSVALFVIRVMAGLFAITLKERIGETMTLLEVASANVSPIAVAPPLKVTVPGELPAETWYIYVTFTPAGPTTTDEGVGPLTLVALAPLVPVTTRRLAGVAVTVLLDLSVMVTVTRLPPETRRGDACRSVRVGFVEPATYCISSLGLLVVDSLLENIYSLLVVEVDLTYMPLLGVPVTHPWTSD